MPRVIARLWFGVLLGVVMTPLLSAQAPDCEQWNTEAYFRAATGKGVKACLEAGADPNARTEEGYTPLHNAAGFNQFPAVIEALLQAGAALTVRDEWNRTPLMRARYNENLAVIKSLLKAGADARTDFQWTPLHEAVVLSEDPAVIKALLQAGADPMARVEEGFAPLFEEEGYTPLHFAARVKGNAVVIEVLLKAAADPNARAEDKDTPLHGAAQFNDEPEVVVVLLEADADPMARNADGKTPWDLAQDNEGLKGSDAYWRLSEARFESLGRDRPRSRTTGGVSAGKAEGAAQRAVPDARLSKPGGCESRASMVPGWR